MGKKLIIGVAGLVVVALGVVAGASNALRTTGEARFSKGENGLNQLSVRGKVGIRVIVYSIGPGSGGTPTVGGSGRSTMPFFGSHVEFSNRFPEQGETLGIEPEKHVRISAAFDPAGATTAPSPANAALYGTYVLLTEDPSWADRLATEAPAVKAAAPAPAPGSK